MKALDGNPGIARGLALLCSVPPSGNGPMSKRFLDERGTEVVWDIFRGFVFGTAASDPQLCKRFFFSEGMSDSLVAEYMRRFEENKKPFFDLSSVVRRLPILTATGEGEAPWLKQGTSNGVTLPSRLVVGAQDDFIVDATGVRETARYLGVDPVFVDGAHDVMLDVNQEATAERILDWIRET
mmetsp:Transcript_34144/g.66104  ORF Transcript_34144/g.66104 Transcript_34144/m.66104 type:complete len:182 (+) Transcript_34144:185-730(+)